MFLVIQIPRNLSIKAERKTDNHAEVHFRLRNDLVIRKKRRPKELFFSKEELIQSKSFILKFPSCDLDGKKSIDKGWLTGQTEIHFRLHHDPVNMWKRRHKEQTYSIRCTPIDLRYKDVSLKLSRNVFDQFTVLANMVEQKNVLR